MMWCITTTRMCSVGGKARTTGRETAGAFVEPEGLAGFGRRPGDGFRLPLGGLDVLQVDDRQLLRLGRARRLASAGRRRLTIFVRSDSCRATNSVNVRCKASTSSGPVSRIAMGML